MQSSYVRSPILNSPAATDGPGQPKYVFSVVYSRVMIYVMVVLDLTSMWFLIRHYIQGVGYNISPCAKRHQSPPCRTCVSGSVDCVVLYIPCLAILLPDGMALPCISSPLIVKK